MKAIKIIDMTLRENTTRREGALSFREKLAGLCGSGAKFFRVASAHSSISRRLGISFRKGEGGLWVI